MNAKPQPISSKYTASEFAMMLAFELGYKACERGKNFQQAFEDFKRDIFSDEPRKEQP